MFHRRCCWAVWAAIYLFSSRGLSAEPAGPVDLSLVPATATLRGPTARLQLLVCQVIDGHPVDQTRIAEYRIEPADLADVNSDGVLIPRRDGDGFVIARLHGRQTKTVVQIRGMSQPPPVTFERDIEPVLTRFGCNAGPCHGKARGQNGFALSLLGYDAEFDFRAITAEARGRRLFPANPTESLLLKKASARMSHGGGRRLPESDPNYELVRRWIADGCPRTPANSPTLLRITVEPSERVLSAKSEQQLAVTAHYSDNSREDVTRLATFQSSESVLANVNAEGRVRAGPLPGEAAVTARYMEKFSVCHVLIPAARRPSAESYAALPRRNFIDGLVWDKLQRLGIAASDPASESTFHRRVHLDLIGRLPTPEQTRRYLADPAPDKRAKLIDEILDRPEYADFWANKWVDLLRPNPYRVGIKAVFNFDAWIRDVFRKNMPYDQFVRELLTARGSTFRNGATVMFRDRREPEEIAPMVSQLFLGVRLECAKCHHHPFEVWSQDDFYSFAAFFARVAHRGTGLSPPISGGEEFIGSADRGEVKHPVTGRVLAPRPLLGAPLKETYADLRLPLADWVTSAENPYFARVQVNRVWADLMGRGLVEPVDDIRATNPASNGPLLDALAADFRKSGYDLKKLLKTIASSHAYSLSSLPDRGNELDARNHARHYRQRLRAEVLLDAISDVTGVGESFGAMPAGSRAVAVWTARTPSVFLDSFGRPDPNQDPPCERAPETTVVQALHLMNAPNLHRKITADDGRAAQLAAGSRTPTEIADELYLQTYCRFPTAAEREAAVNRFNKPGAIRRLVIEDLMWALINSPEFVFVD